MNNLYGLFSTSLNLNIDINLFDKNNGSELIQNFEVWVMRNQNTGMFPIALIQMPLEDDVSEKRDFSWNDVYKSKEKKYFIIIQ